MGNPQIVVPLKLDTAPAKRQLSELHEVGVEVGIDQKDLARIKNLEDKIDSLDVAYKKLGASKLNTKTFDDATKKISDTVNDVKQTVEGLKNSFLEISKAFNTADQQRITKAFDNMARSVGDVNNAAINTTAAIKSANQSFENVGIISSKNEKELRRQAKAYDDIIVAANDAAKAAKEVSVRKDSEKDARIYARRLVEHIDVLRDQYIDLQEAEENFTGDKESVAFIKIQREIAETISKFEVYVSALKNLTSQSEAVSKSKFAYTEYNARYDNEIIQDLNRIKGVVAEKVADINAQLREIGAMAESGNATGQMTSKGIAVPLYVSTKPGTFLKMVESVLKITQETVAKEPIEVRISLISDYKSKKNAEILEQMATQIGDIPDVEIREKFSTLLLDMQKQFAKEVNLHITTDIDQAESNVRKGIGRIKKELNKKGVYVTPEFTFKDTDINKLQRQLNRISKQLELNINKIVISEKAIKDATGNGKKKNLLVDAEAIKDSAALVALLDKMIEKENIFGAESYDIVQSLEDVKLLLQQMPFEEIISPVREFVSLFSRFAGILTKSGSVPNNYCCKMAQRGLTRIQH